MPDKQERYRKRNAAQGLQRVEVIVPKALAPYLKAYARALRDAHALGMEPPLFEGMRVSLQNARSSEGNCHVNTGPLAALDIFRSCYA